MSALAYLSFEVDNHFKGIVNVISKAAMISLKQKDRSEVSKHFSELEKNVKDYIDQKLSGKDNDVEPLGLCQLKEALKCANFDLCKTFNEGDTQAFIAKRDIDNIAVLAFRGTEASSWNDVKTDLNIRFYKGKDGIKLHTGFCEAYNQVSHQVETAVNELPTAYSLYITGHSLGDALAIIATKELERDSVAACYTFCSPRVGNEEFGEEIRVPIYRIVNAAD